MRSEHGGRGGIWNRFRLLARPDPHATGKISILSYSAPMEVSFLVHMPNSLMRRFFELTYGRLTLSVSTRT